MLSIFDYLVQEILKARIFKLSQICLLSYYFVVIPLFERVNTEHECFVSGPMWLRDRQRHREKWQYKFARAAVTTYHQLVAYNNRNSPTVLEARSPTSGCPQGHTPSETLGRILPYIFQLPVGAINPWHSLARSASSQSLPLLSYDLPVCLCLHIIRTPAILG